MVKNPPVSLGNMNSIPGSRRSLGVGNGNPFQNHCLGNPMDRGAWRAIAHGVTKALDVAYGPPVCPDRMLCEATSTEIDMDLFLSLMIRR